MIMLTTIGMQSAALYPGYSQFVLNGTKSRNNYFYENMLNHKAQNLIFDISSKNVIAQCGILLINMYYGIGNKT